MSLNCDIVKAIHILVREVAIQEKGSREHHERSFSRVHSPGKAGSLRGLKLQLAVFIMTLARLDTSILL